MKLFFKTSGTELWTEKKPENFNLLCSVFEEASELFLPCL